MAATKKLTLARLKDVLIYDPTTGQFTWLDKPHPRSRTVRGSVAGSINGSGYVNIKLDGVTHKSHILAWFYMTGEWPDHRLDHRNTIKSDNRWDNLREAPGSANHYNTAARKNNALGLKGVHANRGRFKAQIKHNGKVEYLGRFDTSLEAHAAYLTRATEVAGEFARG